MISKRRHRKEIDATIVRYEETIHKLTSKYDADLALEFDRARLVLAEKLRVLLLDFNYDVFQLDASTLKPRVYAFISVALNEFHERAIR